MAADDEGGGMKTAKLDMGHGFMRHIIKNQVDRDDYDKEVKFAKMQQRPPRRTPCSNKPKKPNIELYTPPARGQGVSNNPLFKLEFESDSGKITEFMVEKGDKAEILARKFGAEIGLDQALIKALEIRISEEIKKREDR
ncbi:UPF0561 protein C2orf68 homolog isoform X2 [Ptychodera flava]|uniref:UPF0561 protein C2orf68 homolog isoform X2 n=1 Tax=Ptychodera flava TaxID=63121 RepID=UPI00396A711A